MDVVLGLGRALLPSSLIFKANPLVAFLLHHQLSAVKVLPLIGPAHGQLSSLCCGGFTPHGPFWWAGPFGHQLRAVPVCAAGANRPGSTWVAPGLWGTCGVWAHRALLPIQEDSSGGGKI